MVTTTARANNERIRLLAAGKQIGGFFSARRKGTCIWFGFLIFSFLALFPPWMQTWQAPRGPRHESKPLWHAPLYRPPTPSGDWWVAEVDYPRLYTEVAISEGFVLALYLTWARPRRP
jgi:hypothetical protein